MRKLALTILPALFLLGLQSAALAEDVLKQGGYTNVQHLKGDMLGWEAEGRPVER